MRVGLYNRWLATLGGGEKHSLAIAEYLISQKHSVTVISHSEVSREEAATRFNLDLSRVEFISIPDRPPMEMTPVSAEYDFFINASHLDYFPSEAPHSALLVYFPMPLPDHHESNLQRRLKLAAREWFGLPAFVDGLQMIDSTYASFLWLTGAQVKIRVLADSQSYRVSFDLAMRDPGLKEALITLDEQTIQSLSLSSPGRFTHCEITIPGEKQRSYHELIIKGAGGHPENPDDPIKMEVAAFRIHLPWFRLYQLVFERVLKGWGKRLHYYPLREVSILDCIDTYESIWANSRFTQGWIKKYWNRESKVLYPQIDVENFRVGKKRQQILSVGRFFAGSHNKKHLVMIQAFKEMVDEGLSGWEFHLAGGVAPGEAHQEYLRQVHAEAEGYPIFIHTDIAFEMLIDLYAESAIYWHASGYGEDETKDPVKFEHFGITTVEAMASGCVPVVIGKGGQKEIVKHGENGFLWTEIKELKDLTIKLIQSPQLCKDVATAAIGDCRKYDKSHFQAQLDYFLKGSHHGF